MYNVMVLLFKKKGNLDHFKVLPVNGWVLQVQHLTGVVTQDEWKDRILH